jgi:O-antigen ligase
MQPPNSRQKPLLGAYVGLLLFMFIYFSRPEDWIPGMANVPLAKITIILALLAAALSLRNVRQRMPREMFFLACLAAQLLVGGLLSPVWRGGAVQGSIDFAKIVLIFFVIIASVTTIQRLHLLIFTHALSLAVIAAAAVWKGRLIGERLEGFLNGNYADPNDMALAMVISLPLCLALLFLTRNWVVKIFWSISILVMMYAIFLTGSRGGFFAFVAAAAVILWEFAIRGRRRIFLALAVVAGVIVWQLSGGLLADRLTGTFHGDEEAGAAYASAQSRKQLFWRSIDVTKQHPLFGVGVNNFDQVSGQWHTTHNSLTLMSSEGGIPALVLYVLILWCGFKNLRAAKRWVRGKTTPTVLVRALQASLAGFLVGSVFLSVAYQFFPYILVAYTTALFSIARKSSALSRGNKLARQATGEKKVYMNLPESELPFPNFSDPVINAP